MTQNAKMLAGMMDQAYLEIIPTKTIKERLIHLPRHAYVAITCSPAQGVGPTLDMVDELRALPQERQLKLVPHIAARVVRDKGHLREILARLDEARVKSVFIPGGDAAEPVGDYDCALDLLRDIADIGHHFKYVGVAAHPEGHPLVDGAELLRLLKEKQKYSNYLVTQMCFDPDLLISWLRSIRKDGVTLPAWLGLPGVADIPKLIALSLRIGVGQSVRVLKKQKGLVRRMISAKPYQPDDLLAGLQPHLDDPLLDIPGFHLFSFNDVERTERWRVDTLDRLRSSAT
ncbi:MAG: methylenetetrahydrofolate reductase [Xanthomonadales bacterium]|nr:methylenetetrahydrofolate reductase [Xanthomonadales bacterium]